MRNSESVKEPTSIAEHAQSSAATASQVESELSTKSFRVVKTKSQRTALGRPRGGQPGMGRWNPPPRLFET